MAKIICTCNGITDNQLRKAIRENKITDVEALKDKTRAGTCCGMCATDVKFIFEDEVPRRKKRTSL
ncbi:hypothetical protein BVY04_03785 [bacterium M21]|nr:hypothetical protein BVY04_03785 [bacterium M21]